MARPHKQTVDYFPHYSDASSRKTLYILESHFGNNGYAFWFKLLEILASSDGHVYDVRNPDTYEFLLARTHVDKDTCEAIMKLLITLKAIDPSLWKRKIIWCQNLVDNIADAYRNRTTGIPQKPSINGQKPEPTGITDVNNEVSDTDNPQSKLNYTKVKNIIPEWIDKEAWEAFIEMRKKIGKPPTQKAITMLITKLKELKDAGDDPALVLNQSTMRNYTGVFPLDGGKSATNRQNPRKLPKTYTRPEDFGKS